MAKGKSPLERPAPRADHLTATEMSLLERLVDRGVLVAVPAVKSQKPRKVIAAALADGGAKVLLHPSAKPAEFDRA